MLSFFWKASKIVRYSKKFAVSTIVIGYAVDGINKSGVAFYLYVGHLEEAEVVTEAAVPLGASDGLSLGKTGHLPISCPRVQERNYKMSKSTKLSYQLTFVNHNGP
jgi:hypothetical protein